MRDKKNETSTDQDAEIIEAIEDFFTSWDVSQVNSVAFDAAICMAFPQTPIMANELPDKIAILKDLNTLLVKLHNGIGSPSNMLF